mgnify:CR=1 FL=1|jgi:hypothetical protein
MKRSGSGIVFYLSVLLFVLCPCYSQAIDVFSTSDSTALQQSFISGGSVSNFTVTGANGSVGTYTNNSNLWGLGSGIVLSSGNVSNYGDGSNTSSYYSTDWGTSGSSLITNLNGGYSTYDATSIKFDFTATSNKISYDFVFGSEEYAEFVGSSYNDAFGVWLTDSAGSKTQLSFDKSNNPITINTAWMSSSTGTELDGTTGKLTTTAATAIGQNYSIEFVIADSSDAIYDSTVYLSNFTGAGTLQKQANIYGLFVGVHDGDLRSDLSAQNLYNTMSTNLNNFKEGIVLTADMNDGGLSDTQIKDAINDLEGKMSSGDKLFIYLGSHGGTDLIGPETTLSFGDELMKIGNVGDGTLMGGMPSGWDFLTDDELKSYLSGMDGIEKWIMVDSCHSGGFWGNDFLFDEGDLEKLTNISLFAAAQENTDGFYDGDDGDDSDVDTGLLAFAVALNEAYTKDENGHLLADSAPYDNIITFDELTDYVQNHSSIKNKMNGTYVNQADFGDLVYFTSDMWQTASFHSADFVGSGVTYSPNPNPNTNQSPEPATLLLLGLSLAGLAGMRRFKN